MSDIGQIRIYSADADAAIRSAVRIDVWTYSPGSGPVVDGANLNFARSGSNGWPAASP